MEVTHVQYDTISIPHCNKHLLIIIVFYVVLRTRGEGMLNMEGKREKME